MNQPPKFRYYIFDTLTYTFTGTNDEQIARERCEFDYILDTKENKQINTWTSRAEVEEIK